MLETCASCITWLKFGRLHRRRFRGARRRRWRRRRQTVGGGAGGRGRRSSPASGVRRCWPDPCHRTDRRLGPFGAAAGVAGAGADWQRVQGRRRRRASAGADCGGGGIGRGAARRLSGGGLLGRSPRPCGAWSDMLHHPWLATPGVLPRGLTSWRRRAYGRSEVSPERDAARHQDLVDHPVADNFSSWVFTCRRRVSRPGSEPPPSFSGSICADDRADAVFDQGFAILDHVFDLGLDLALDTDETLTS